MQKFFQVVQRGLHFVNRRRHESSRGQGGVGRANPVLAPAEFAGCAVCPAHPFEKFAVNFTDQAQGKRQFIQPL